MTGEQIKELRLKHNYTQFELARKVGVSASTIKVWEGDRQTPKRENLKRLKAVLGIGEPEPTDEEKERERELRIYYMQRMNAKADNWTKLDDNDPDLMALRELMDT